MQQFPHSTTAEEARHLTALCLQAIAQGWPIAYAKTSTIQAANNQPRLDLDLDRMLSDAADMAAGICKASDERMV